VHREISRLKGKFDRSQYEQRIKYEEEKESLLLKGTKFFDLWTDLYDRVLKLI